MFLQSLSPSSRRGVYALAIVLAAVVALPLLDWTSFAQKLSGDATASLGRRVEIGGLRLALLPRPNVTLEEVVVSEPDRRSLFARFDSARFSLGWSGLWHGRAELVDARIEGLHLGIAAGADGRLNIDDLLTRKPKSDRIDWQPRRVDLVGAAVDWRADGQVTRFRNLDLHAIDPEGEAGAVTVQGQVAAADWAGGLRIDSGLRIDRPRLTARLKDFRLAVNAATPEWHEGRFELAGDLAAAALPWRGVLSQARARASAQRGDQHWQANFRTPELRGGEAGLSTGRVDAEFGIKSASLELAGQLRVEKLAADAAGSLLADAARVRMQLLDDDQNAQFDFESPLRIEGWRRVSLEGFALTGGYRHKALPRGAIRLELGGRAALDLEKERFDWDSRGQLDGAEVSAQLSLENFVSPKYAFGLDLAKLDLTPYLPVADSAPLAGAASQPLDWGWLGGANARGQLRLGELDIGRFRVFNLQAGIDAANRKLRLEPLAADVYGGQLKGRLLLDAGKTPKLQLTQTLAGMEIAALMSDLFGIERLAGRGTVNLDVGAPATSLDALRRGLNGRMDLMLTRGAITGFDLGETLREWRGNLAKLTGTTLKADTGRRMRFSDLSARFVIKDGVAESRDLAIRAPFVTMDGAGRLDIGAGQVDYLLNAVVRGGSGIPELDALKGTRIPLQIGGPLASPTYRVDTTALREKLAAPVAASTSAKPAAAPAERQATAPRR
ncbi:AsmA family protein [Chitinimonas koreensis]|uniref:AsmA family protein n=1 Tax=Chitinimonas koreensis TaxID=356302 RepID=UPI000406C892|nr:AsmA family protein [Chitinimonas koreensis]QNM97317.1 AsmA family protein [Chitinimonas koreensis]